MDGYDILKHVHDHEDEAVLATLLAVEGHAYRKPGTSMLLLSDGGRIGSLSPGCIDSDLHERAINLLADDRPEVVAYNLQPEEDAIWGEDIGCGGKLQVLLEPLNAPLRRNLSDAYLEVEAGREAIVTRYVSALERVVSSTYAPRPRLFVFGADDGSLPIVELAALSGFRIAVGDWRAALCHPERYPKAACEVGTAAELVERLAVGREDYIVICSHHTRRDREMLELALAIRPIYLGVMGSSSRIKRLFDGLPMPSWVHAPVGMPIGADGPHQIAVSIVAELIAHRNHIRREQEVKRDGIRRNLFGGGQREADGVAQAVPDACPWQPASRRDRASEHAGMRQA